VPVSSTALLSLAELKTLLGIPALPPDLERDARLEALINAVSIWIENYTGRYFVIRETVEQHFPPKQNGWPLVQDYAGWSIGQTLFVRRYPIVTLTSVVDPSGFVIPLTEINVRNVLGELYRSGGWFMPIDQFGTPAQWAITMDVGYFNSTTDVSYDLKLAASMMVAIRASTGAVAGGFVFGPLTSRTLGKVSASYGAGGAIGEGAIAQGIPDEVTQILGPWMSRDV
jgi:hypothetical protein